MALLKKTSEGLNDLKGMMARAEHAISDAMSREQLARWHRHLAPTASNGVAADPPSSKHFGGTSRNVRAPVVAEDRASLGRAERAILSALSSYPHGRNKRQLGVIAGYKHSGGGFNNALSYLRSRGLIEGSDTLRITQAGRETAGPVEPLPSGHGLRNYWLQHPDLGRAERQILQVLLDNGPLEKETIASLTTSEKGAPYEPNGGGFNNALSRLRTYELIKSAGNGTFEAAPEFFE